MSENSINEREGPDKEKDEGAVGIPSNFSDMLNKVLANPQILSTVASALSQPTSDDGALSSETVSENTSESKKEASVDQGASPDIAAMAQKLPEIMNLLGPAMSSGKSGKNISHASDKRTCLLSAIKPYMSPARCEAIDYIIKFSQISEILKKLN